MEIEEIESELKKILEGKVSIKEKRTIPRTIPETKELYLRNLKVYLYILNYLKKDLDIQWIRKKLGMKYNTFQKYHNKLKTLKFIEKIGYGVWEITRSGSQFLDKNLPQLKGKPSRSLRGMPSIVLEYPRYSSSPHDFNSHAIVIKVPILKDESRIDFFDYESDMTTWIAKYKKISELGITIKKTTDNFILYLEPFNYKDPEMIDLVVREILGLTKVFLETKNIQIDLTKASISNQEHAYRDPHVDKMKGLKSTVKVPLNRNRKKILSNDPDKLAHAWGDGTPFKFNYETDDKLYAQKLLMMPELIHSLSENIYSLSDSLVPTIKDLNVNLKTHILALQGIDSGVKEWNKSQKSTNEVLGKLDQSISQLSKPLQELRDIETIAQSMKEGKEYGELECPKCHARFSEKILEKRNNHCPSCYVNLSLFKPSLIKKNQDRSQSGNLNVSNVGSRSGIPEKIEE